MLARQTRIVLVSTAAVAATALTSPPAFTGSISKPTVKRCLAAWNSSANAVGQVHLHRLGKGILQLDAGKSGRDSVGGGGTSSSNGGPACVLMFFKSSTARWIDGAWSHGTVSRWTFGPTVDASHTYVPQSGNVRADVNGRLHRV